MSNKGTNILDFSQSDLGFYSKNGGGSGVLSVCGGQVILAAKIFGHGGEQDVFEFLRKEFGFQIGNVENMREAAILLVGSYMASRGIDQVTAIEAVRRDLTFNYSRWCKYHCIVPADLKHKTIKKWHYNSCALEIALIHLIWGEAANMRHAPEFLCFVFDDFCRRLTSGTSKSRQIVAPYMAQVIKPAFDLMTQFSKIHGDHCKKPNYDDFNELFHDRVSVTHFRAELCVDEKSYSDAIFSHRVPKTYYETRSYTHLLRSCFRVITLHAVSLHILITIAGCGGIPSDSCSIAKSYLDCGLTLAGMLSMRELIEVLILGKPYASTNGLISHYLAVYARFVRRIIFLALFPILLYLKVTHKNLGALGDLIAGDGRGNSSVAERRFELASGFLLALTVALEFFRIVFGSWPRVRNFLFRRFVRHPILGELLGGEWRTYYSATSIIAPPLLERLGVMTMWIIAYGLKLYVSYHYSILPLVILARKLRDPNALNADGTKDDAFRWFLLDWEFRRREFTALGFTDARHLTLVISTWLPASLFFFLDTEVYYILIWTCVSAVVAVRGGVSAYLQPSEILAAIKRIPSVLQIGDVNTTSFTRGKGKGKRYYSAASTDNSITSMDQYCAPVFPEDEEEGYDERKTDDGVSREEVEDETIRRLIWFAAVTNEMARTMREQDLLSDEELRSMLYTIDDDILGDENARLSMRDLTYPEVYFAINTPDAQSDALVKSAEVWRRLGFLASSLRTIVQAGGLPAIATTKASTTLVPYYNETVIPSLKSLEEPTSEGVTVFDLLRAISPIEFKNLLQRIQIQGDLEAAPRETVASEIERFAAFRSQTLLRTASGLAYYDRMLQLLGKLADALSHPGAGIDAALAKKLLEAPLHSDFSYRLATPKEYSTFAQLKYTIVLSCQIFGDMRAAPPRSPKRLQAEQIEGIMREFPNIRIAYIDKKDSASGSGEPIFSSVLVKWDQESDKVVEIYRIILPGNAFPLGEAKPTNQNASIIFTRGEAIQAIDMNQSGFFEEALKLPYFLQNSFGNLAEKGPQIAGHREHIFTNEVSSLSSFMSMQESLFVTSTQRILDKTHARFHYGHPDFFGRAAAMTCGGMAKCSKGINLSEDIFGGFNFVLRGGKASQSDLVQVGKGKDVGFAQIYTFLGKISQGNAEQLLSRDVYRVNTQTDIFRHMTIFWSSIGHFLSQVGIIAVVLTGVYVKLFVTVRGIAAAVNSNSGENGDRVAELMNDTLFGSQLLGLYLFVLISSFIALAVELGFLASLSIFFSKMLLRGGVFFFAHTVATKSSAVHSTIVEGKATYQATGRGFDIEHATFLSCFQRYWKSHFILGSELCLVLWVHFAGLNFRAGGRFFRNEVIPWFFVVALLWTPFLFNPHGFDYLRVIKDWNEWTLWMGARPSLGRYASLPAKQRDERLAAQSWTHWWRQTSQLVDRPLGTRLFLVLLPRSRRLILFWGLCELSASASRKGRFRFGTNIAFMAALVFAVGLLVAIQLFHSRSKKVVAKEWLHAPQRRIRGFIINGTILTAFAAFLLFRVMTLRALVSLIFAVFTMMYLIADTFLIFSKSSLFRGRDTSEIIFVRKTFQVAHALCGAAIFAPVLVVSFLPWMAEFQSRLLWNIDFSARLDAAKVFARQRKAKATSPSY